ncbi:hemolysin family protein [Salinilacihabitans rarus]|uniref:hemolysin family protein n=1 Tax=Salinilacihabitans rarus TaxID=2961596 RepID=UPI0020C8E5B5|nr:hemolysin family protein [Salinilacihabitans rarus]
MVDVAFSAARLLVAFFLVFLNGFFVAAEFAFVRIRSTTVETLVEEGRPGATVLQEAVDNLDDYLAVTQLGITISSLGLGWIGEPAVAALIEAALGPVLPESAIHLAAFGIGFGTITFLHVVFGELAPKTIAIQEAERISLLVAAPMKGFYYLFVPGIVVFNGTANYFTRLIGVSPASETEETLSEEEIRMVLSRSGRQGEVDAEEVEMIERVFELDDTTARAVMIPRPDVVSVPADATLSELRAVVAEEGHTRYPVVGEDEEVVGLVDVKDVLLALDSADPSTTADDLAREITVVPETTRVDDLLAQLQDESRQVAAVIDEWGSFEGVVTVEDLVEVIVGDIRDQFDPDDGRTPIETVADGAHAVEGGLPLAAVNETLGTAFESDDVETIGGLVLERLGRVPEAGDRVTVGDHALEVAAVDGSRVTEVVVREGATADLPE